MTVARAKAEAPPPLDLTKGEQTSTDVRHHWRVALNALPEVDSIVITRLGKPAAVLMSWELHDEWRKTGILIHREHGPKMEPK